MSLTISEEAKQRLAPFLTEANTFLLVANDGSFRRRLLYDWRSFHYRSC